MGGTWITHCYLVAFMIVNAKSQYTIFSGAKTNELAHSVFARSAIFSPSISIKTYLIGLTSTERFESYLSLRFQLNWIFDVLMRQMCPFHTSSNSSGVGVTIRGPRLYGESNYLIRQVSIRHHSVFERELKLQCLVSYWFSIFNFEILSCLKRSWHCTESLQCPR